MRLSELLRAIKDNPDDLSPLAEAITQAEALEEREADQAERIGKLQENYRKAIQMIPVPDPEPKAKEQKDPEISLDDAVQALKNYL